MLGLRFCARAFSSCGERGPLFIAVRGPLTITASLVAEHRLQTHRLSSCGSRAQLLRGMWDLPRSGLEPMSPVLAGRFSTTGPPGKPWRWCFWTESGKLGWDCVRQWWGLGQKQRECILSKGETKGLGHKRAMKEHLETGRHCFWRKVVNF